MRKLYLIFPYVYIVLVITFLYVPVLVMIIMAFNRSPFYTLPIQPSLHWFRDFLSDQRLIRATYNSIVLALATMTTATILGTLASIGLVRRFFRGKNFFLVLLIPPITIPWLILAISMLLLFQWSSLGRSIFTMFLGHVAVALPYAILVISIRLRGLDITLEEAALSLGARPITVFRRITLPLILPGVIAGALFSFVVSFDNFVISYFLAPPGVSTLPVEIYTAIRKGFSPAINAASTMIFIISLGLVICLGRLISFKDLS